MAPLVIYLIDSENMLNSILKNSINCSYHILFVLSNKKYKNIINQNKYQIIVFDFAKYDSNTLIKLIISYTDSLYTHYLIYSKYSEMVAEDIYKLEDIECKSENEAVIFSKNYFIFNNINFNIKKQELENPFDHFELMDQALNGYPVNEKYFLEALRELLPECRYDILNQNLEIEIKNILLEKNTSNNIVYIVDNKKTDGVKNQIIFTPSEIESYKFIIKRDDGLNCYIL